jgi:rhodanese-related sulfurtransferase
MWSYDFNEVLLSKIVQKNQEVVLYSSRGIGGDRILNALGLAVSWGFEKVYFYRNGMAEWGKAGYPVDDEKIDVGFY